MSSNNGGRRPFLHEVAREWYAGQYNITGKRPTTRDIAKKFKISPSTVKRWMDTGWGDYAESARKQISESIREEIRNEIEKQKESYRQIIRALMGQLVKRIKAINIRNQSLAPGEPLEKYPVEIRDVTDLERIIKLDLLLAGEATERGELIEKSPFELWLDRHNINLATKN